MRVSILLGWLILAVAACGGTNEGSGLHASSKSKSSTDDDTSSSKASKNKGSGTVTQAPTGGVDDSPATPAPSTTATSTPAPTTTPPPPSAPPPAGSCGNPKCISGFGSCGCTAKDSNGTTVQLGCQDGQCACFDGFQQQTTDVFEGDCADAQGAFFANCGCD